MGRSNKNSGEFVEYLREQLHYRELYLKHKLVLLGYVREYGDMFNVAPELEDDLGRDLQYDSINYELNFIKRHYNELNNLVVRREIVIDNVMKYEVDKITQTEGNVEVKHFDKLLEDYDLEVDYRNLDILIKEYEDNLTELGYRINSDLLKYANKVGDSIRESMDVIEMQKADLIECLAMDRYVIQVIKDYLEEKEEGNNDELKEETYKSILDILN